jgi:hypothetical protein
MGVIDDARAATRGALCSVLNGLDAIDRFGVGLGIRGNVPPNFPGSPAGNLINNGQALFCDRMPEFLPPPFTGGQCIVKYRVFFKGFRIPTSTGNRIPIEGNTSSRTYTGPIKGITPGANGNGVFILHGTNLTTVAIDPVPTNTYDDMEITSVQRIDGLPDDCGNYSPPPLTDPERRRPININNNDGDIIFAFPILNVNGDLTVPFNLNVGELNLSGEVELNTGDINFNFGGQPTDPDTPEVPTPDGEPPDGDDDDPEDDKPANIIGVVVVSRQSGNAPATELTFPNSPNVLIPRVATVQFKIRIKNKSHWTSEIPVRSKNAYIHCPAEIDAIDVVTTSDPGWIVSATPVRGIVPSNQVELL